MKKKTPFTAIKIVSSTQKGFLAPSFLFENLKASVVGSTIKVFADLSSDLSKLVREENQTNEGKNQLTSLEKNLPKTPKIVTFRKTHIFGIWLAQLS